MVEQQMTARPPELGAGTAELSRGARSSTLTPALSSVTPHPLLLPTAAPKPLTPHPLPQLYPQTFDPHTLTLPSSLVLPPVYQLMVTHRSLPSSSDAFPSKHLWDFSGANTSRISVAQTPLGFQWPIMSKAYFLLVSEPKVLASASAHSRLSGLQDIRSSPSQGHTGLRAEEREMAEPGNVSYVFYAEKAVY